MLSDADIAELRREWILDVWDAHGEWGALGSAKVAAPASAGADTLGLSGLGTGTLRSGTNFVVISGGVTIPLTVKADAAITAGAATVTVAPRLPRAVTTNDPARVEPDREGPVARVFGERENRPMFSAVDIQALAMRAEERWGQVIRTSLDPRRFRFMAIAYFAIVAQQRSAKYEQAVSQMDAQDGGRGHYDRLESMRVKYETALSRQATGPRFIEVYI
jgi:hypothetical protein